MITTNKTFNVKKAQKTHDGTFAQKRKVLHSAKLAHTNKSFLKVNGFEIDKNTNVNG